MIEALTLRGLEDGIFELREILTHDSRPKIMIEALTLRGLKDGI